MKKLFISFLIASVFLLQSAFAADFSVIANNTPEYSFFAARTDQIAVTISNTVQTDLFQVSVIGVPIEWLSIPIESSTLSVPSAGSASVNIIVEPSKDAMPGVYKYFLKVTRLSSGESYEQELLVNVVQTTSAILKDLTLSCTTCTDEINVSGEVVNVGSKQLELSVALKCEDIQKTIDVGTVKVGERKDLLTSINVSSMTPGSYAIDISLIDSTGRIRYNESMPFSIPSVENLVYDNSVSMTPFGSSITVKATNLGNVALDAELKSLSPTNWYTIITGPSPSGMATGYYYWTMQVGPKQSVNINYAEIYWPTYVIIIAAIIAFLFIYNQTSAFTFSKTVMGSSSIRSGKDISVSLHIKSKRKGVDRIAIRDIVPANFSIVSKFDTVKPLIRKVANGIELVWKISELKPNEERVLHYTIRPNAEVDGKVTLPAALAKTMSARGLKLKYSNRIALAAQGSLSRAMPVKVAK